jgi:hypothetical protein
MALPEIVWVAAGGTASIPTRDGRDRANPMPGARGSLSKIEMMKSSEIPTTCLESRTQICEWPLARRGEGSEALGCQGGGKVSGFFAPNPHESR